MAAARTFGVESVSQRLAHSAATLRTYSQQLPAAAAVVPAAAATSRGLSGAHGSRGRHHVRTYPRARIDTRT